MPSATVRKIAMAAGVSRTTVSLALRNDPRLPAKTRERLQSLALHLGYRPDPRLSELMTYLSSSKESKSTAKIGLLSNWPERSHWKTHPILERYMSGIVARSKVLGYDLEEFWLREPGMTARRMNRILQNRGIGGLIVFSASHWTRHLSFDFSPFATVAIEQAVWRPSLHCVTHHIHQAVQQIFHRLKGSLSKRVGLALFGDDPIRSHHQYEATYLYYQNLQPGTERIPIHHSKGYRSDEFLKWYRKHRPRTVITPLWLVVPWLESIGVRIPQETRVITTNWTTEYPILSGIDRCEDQIGSIAVDQIATQLHRHEKGIPTPHRTVMIEGVWRAGKTFP